MICCKRKGISYLGVNWMKNGIQRYYKVAHLLMIWKVLPAGDETIGERGINLSGGQKARVSLA